MPLWLIHLAAETVAASESPLLRTEVIVALVACFGVITAAVLTYLGVKRSSDMSRVTQLETRLNQSDAINKGMWMWNRGLQDQVWKQAPPPPLEPPEWLRNLLDK